MNLPVLQPQSSSEPWYAGGLRFTCTQCGNCCTGGPGYVWITHEEIVHLAEYLKLTPEQVVERYCRKINGQFSLKENLRQGKYDCIFLKEQKVERPAEAGKNEKAGHDEKVLYSQRVCSVYPVRPLQCRTWPFWSSNLASAEAWNRAAQRCPGINQGRRFTAKQIEKRRDVPQE